MIRRGSFLSNAWLVTGSSLAAVAILVFLLWSMGSRPSVRAKTLRLYCAMGMRPAMRGIIEKYEAEFGASIQADYKGTGELMMSLGKIGVPGDLFLSADSTTMQDAVRAGLIEEVLPIAEIRPVLVVHRQTQEKLTRAGKPVKSLEDLLREDVKVALANETAAIGRVGKTVLQAQGLWDKLEKRRKRSQALVSNVGTVMEVAQRVSQMEGFVGLVWDATANDYPNLVVLKNVPGLDEVVEHVEIGVLKKSGHPTAALHFARYATARDQGLKDFAAHKFKVVADADWWVDRPKIHIAAGSMLKPGLEPVLKTFSNREGVDFDPVTTMGCGLLVSQMEAIARDKNYKRFPDLFVSCDLAFNEMIKSEFEPIVERSKKMAGKAILQNDLVIIVPKGNPKNIKGLDDLKREDLKKIGLPHPSHSAMGKLIVDMLKENGFPGTAYDATKNPRIVNQSAADLLVSQIRSLDMAIVGRSNALSNPANLERLDILEDVVVTTATQAYSISRHTRHKYLMQRLVRTLTSPASLDRFRKMGFHTEPKLP